MTRLAIVCFLVAATSVPLSAQTDAYGDVDTLYAELERIAEDSWSITISLTNDENIVAISLPMRMTAGLTRIIADSASFLGGRVADWDYLVFKADTAVQAVTLGMIANVGPTRNRLTPGGGRLATVFVSSLDGSPLEKLVVDTTTTYPDNKLEIIADSVQPTTDDTTTHVPMAQRKIYPVWVVRESR